MRYYRIRETNVNQARTTLFILSCLIACAVSARSAEPSPVTMLEPREYPWAGLRLAIPAGFEPQPLAEIDQVLQANRIQGRKATQSLSVYVHVVEDPEATAESVSASLIEPLKDSLAFRNLKEVKAGKMPLAGQEGFARRLTFTHRGQKTIAVSACVIRNVQRPAKNGKTRKPAPLRLAYILAMEVALGKEGQHTDVLLRTFDAVARSMHFIGLQHPADMPLVMEGRPFAKHFPKGIALRQPEHWVAAVTETGLAMGITDYLLGGQFTPAVQVLAMNIPEGQSAKTCGMKYIQHQRKEGLAVEVFAEGPATLADRKGYQYVLRRTLRPTTRPASAPADNPHADTDVIEIQRGICLPDKADPESCRHVTLLLTCRYADRKKALALMDQFADALSLFTPVK